MPFHISTLVLKPSSVFMDDPLPTFLPLTLLAQLGVCVFVCVSELFDSSWVLSVMNLSGFWVLFLLLQLTSFMPSFPTYINASSASGNSLCSYPLFFSVILCSSVTLHVLFGVLSLTGIADMAVNHHHVNPNGCFSNMPSNRKLKVLAF